MKRLLQPRSWDPGGDIEAILATAEANRVTPLKILLTHAHIDHAGAAFTLAEQLSIPIEGPHIDDQFWIDALPQQSEMFNFPAAQRFTPNRWLVDGDTVEFGEQRLEVHHCPGHTPGHVIFFHREQTLAFVGDVLFRGSIGRTDFPKGDHQTLITSIQSKLWPLGQRCDIRTRTWPQFDVW